MVLVNYETLAQMLHLIILLFQSVTDIVFKCNGVQWWNVDIFVWISLWT